MDSRLQVGDEIISINNHSTMNCTQREVLGLMKDLTTQGALEVTFRVRREMPLANSSFVSRTLPTGLSIPPRRSSKPPEGKREVVLTKSASENFGLTVKSNLHKKGCSINSVIPGSSAELSGQLYRGDILLGVNCQDVSSMEREDVIFLIKNSAPSVRLTVKQPDDSDGHTMHVY
jgi:C-terminal processing protease CtpA/Prc